MNSLEVITDPIKHDAARTLEAGLIRSRIQDAFDSPNFLLGSSVEATLGRTGLQNLDRGRIPDNWMHGLQGDVEALKASPLWKLIKEGGGDMLYPNS